jgi:hypothetical protein
MDKWIYIVSWTLVSISFVNCPQISSVKDEYGRKSRTNNCYNSYVSTTKIFYDKGFKDRITAFKFYNKALKQKEILVPNKLKAKDYLIFVEIDSTRNKRR